MSISIQTTMFTLSFRKTLLLAAIWPLQAVFATPPSISISSGWQEVSLSDPGAAVPRTINGYLAVSDELLVISYSSKIALIDARTGSERALVSRPGDMGSSFTFATNAGFIDGRLLVVSTNYEQMRFDELDTTSGEWIRSLQWTSTQSFAPGSPVLFGDEIRLRSTSTYSVFRFNRSDWSPLPTLALNPSNQFETSLDALVGTSYLTNYNSDGFVLETLAGSTLQIPVPSGRKLVADFAVSRTFLAIPCQPEVSAYNELLVWKCLDPASPPIRIPPPNYVYQLKIWKDRYLIGVGSNFSGSRFLLIWDLENPEQLPGRFPLPRQLENAKLATSENHLWLFAPLARLNQTGILCKLDVRNVTRMSTVSVKGTRANESDGKLTFTVTVTPAPSNPLTIRLATASGSATEGVDFVKWDGTVTLTAQSPSASVPVEIIQDNQLENHETMSLIIRETNGALAPNPEATGVISGTPATATTKTDPLPDAGYYFNHPIMLSSGMVMWDYTHRELRFCADGQRKWKVISAVPKGPDWFSPTFLRSENGALLAYHTEIYSNSPLTFVELDVLNDRVISTWTGELPSEYNRKFAISDSLYLVQPPPTFPFFPKIELRRSEDSTLVRMLEFPFEVRSNLASDVKLVGSGNGYSVISTTEGTLFHHLDADGKDSYKFDPDFKNCVGVGTGAVAIARARRQACILEDTEAGVKMDNLPDVSADPELKVAAGLEPNRKGMVQRYALRPQVPVPLQREFTCSENNAGKMFEVDFSESVDVPLTVQVDESSSPADFRISSKPAILPPGARKLVLPFTVLDDLIPENNETQSVTLSVSGNGYSERFDLEVFITDNDSVEYDTESRDKDFLTSTSFDLAEGNPIFAYYPSRIVVDPVSKSSFHQGKNATSELYGYAVAGNSSYAVIGAPGYGATDANSIYIVDRKRKSTIRRISQSGSRTGFGSVLKLVENQIFVGAPGEAVVGSVHSYSVPHGNSLRDFKPPGKPRKGTLFGLSIACDGESLWVGAPREGSGAVYQFKTDTGELVRKLDVPSGDLTNFGQSLATCGSYLAVGAPSQNSSSSVVLYSLKMGSYVGKIATPFPEGGLFGTSLAGLGNSILAIGCPKAPGISSGAVLLHDLTAKGFPLRIMLKPSQDENKYHGPKEGVAGTTNSLCAYNNYLGIQFKSVPKPLDGYQGDTTGGIYSEIVQVSTLMQSPRSTTSAFPVSPRTGQLPAPLIHQEQFSPPSSQGITVTRDSNTTVISLPSLSDFPAGHRLVLEASEDLTAWKDVAFSSDNSPSWIPLVAEAVVDSKNNTIRLGITDSGRQFFRLRSEPPEK